MINEKSIRAVDTAYFSSQFRRPLYDTYCFSEIPATIRHLFSGRAMGLPEDTLVKGSYKQVVLLFVDAFGWAFFEKYMQKVPFLKRAINEGVCSKLTSLFPSTTSAHVTCITTGLLPIQSGIYEWFIYEPALNEIISPLPFNYPGERKHSTLELDPKLVFPQTTLFHRLAEEGVTSYSYQPKSIVDSIYSKTVLAGSHRHGYTRVEEGLNELLANIEEGSYSFFYYPDVDSIGHRKGVGSEPFSRAIEEIFDQINAFAEELPKDTALIITADHGMVDVSPKETLYLNKVYRNLGKSLKTNRHGKPLVPAGSCRDFFLHVEEDRLLELKEVLQLQIGDKGEVWETKDLMRAGIFSGLPATDHFIQRVGDLVVLPYKGEAIWWYEKGRFQQNFYGAHGGMTPQEMEIPFIFLPL